MVQLEEVRGLVESKDDEEVLKLSFSSFFIVLKRSFLAVVYSSMLRL